MAETPQPTGTVRLIHRFPVKGMAGEELSEVFVSFSRNDWRPRLRVCRSGKQNRFSVDDSTVVARDASSEA